MPTNEEDLLDFRNQVEAADALAWDCFEGRIEMGPVKEAMEAVQETLAKLSLPSPLAEQAQEHVLEAGGAARHRRGASGARLASHHMAELRRKLDLHLGISP